MVLKKPLQKGYVKDKTFRKTGAEQESMLFYGNSNFFFFLTEHSSGTRYFLSRNIRAKPNVNKLQNLPIDVHELHKIRRSTDYEALKLR